MKLWHDDVRCPPDDTWTWAKSNAEARALLSQHEVTECSLDHDLGAVTAGVDPRDIMYLAGSSPEGSGYDLVTWMIENEKVPPVVTIHSWNPPGARRMAAALNDAGHDCVVRPYQI